MIVEQDVGAVLRHAAADFGHWRGGLDQRINDEQHEKDEQAARGPSAPTGETAHLRHVTNDDAA
jgi:hypothetical protein